MKKLILSILCLLSLNTLANDGAFIEEVTTSGSGCLVDEGMTVLSPDQKTLSVLFDNYVVEAGEMVGVMRDTKACDIQVKLSVPEGKKVTISKVDYRLYALIPRYGKLRFRATHNIHMPEINFTTRTLTKSKTWGMEFDDEMLIEQKLASSIMSTQCGQDFVLNIGTTIDVQSNSAQEDAYMSLDSMDSGIDYTLEIEDCTKGDRVNRGRRPSRTHRRNTSNPYNRRKPRGYLR